VGDRPHRETRCATPKCKELPNYEFCFKCSRNTFKKRKEEQSANMADTAEKPRKKLKVKAENEEIFYLGDSHAERTIGLFETTGKACLMEKGLPPEDHPASFHAAEFLLNRIPPSAALARDSPDGDAMRPLEMLTMGQVSRSAINRQLASFVLPGTLVWVHDAKAKGSSLTDYKAVPRVAKEMEGHQLVCFSPVTRQEMKTDSYILVNPGSQVNWRDQLGIAYTKPQSSLSYLRRCTGELRGSENE